MPENNRPAFARSYETQRVLDLMAASGDKILPWSDLEAICGSRDKAASAAGSARRIMLAEGQVWGTVRGLGIKRLSDSEIVQSSDAVQARIRRAARLGLRKLGLATYAELSPAEQRQHDTQATLLSLMAAATDQKRLKQIGRAVEDKKGRIEFRETLELLKG